MSDVAIAVFICLAFLAAIFAGSHVNIDAEKVHLAIDLCEPNGGLEYIDWSNAGCNNGAKINMYKHLDES